MVFNLKAASIIGAVILGSIISPAFHSLRRQCYPMTSGVLLTKALSVAEPILKCREENGQRDYSVFLILANDSGSSSTQVVRLRVVDNKDETTKWEGPDGSGTGQWKNWAIEIFQDRSDKNVEKTSIKVPKDGKTWRRPNQEVSVLCQTSQLQLKTKRGEAGCAGTFLLGTKMKLNLLENNITLSSEEKFVWKEEFKNKPVFCTS